MDVLLMALSFGSLRSFDNRKLSNSKPTNSCPRKLDSNEKRELKDVGSLKKSSLLNESTRITLCLSACLFSLCFLETLPHSWLLLLHNRRSQNVSSSTAHEPTKLYFTVTEIFSIQVLYKIFLYACCIWIMFVLPILLSIIYIENFHAILRNALLSSSRKGSLIRFPFVAIGFIRYIFMKAMIIIFRFVRNLLWKGRKNDENERRRKELPIFRSCRFVSKQKYFIYALGSFLGITVAILALRFLGWKQTLALSFKFENQKYSVLQFVLATLVSRISNVGVLLSTLLNGFGSVSLPYSFFMAIYMKNILTPENLSRKEADLLRTTCFLEKKKEKLQSYSSPKNNHLDIPSDASFHDLSPSSITSQSSHTSRSRFWNRKPSQEKDQISSYEHYGEVQALEKEIKRLESIRTEQEDDYNEFKEMISASTIEIFGLKTLGKVLGAIFTVVLWIRVSNAVRICMSMVEQSFNEQPEGINTDIISLTLNWLIDKELLVEDHYKILSQVLSFLLTIYLSISQVASFSRMRSNLRKKWRGCIGFFWEENNVTNGHVQKTKEFGKLSSINDCIGELLMNFVMGSYFLSCVVLLKINLPGYYGMEFWDALGRPHFFLDRKMINVVFLISVGISAIVLGVSLRKQTLSSKMDATFSSIALDSLLYFGSGV